MERLPIRSLCRRRGRPFFLAAMLAPRCYRISSGASCSSMFGQMRFI